MDDSNIAIEEYIRLEEEKARRRGNVFNWETATYVFNDTLTSETTLSYEPTVSFLNDDIDVRVSFDDFDDEDYTILQGGSEQSHMSIPSLRVCMCGLCRPPGILVNMDDPNITMEEYIRLEEEKARRRRKVFNWETATDNDDDKVDIEHSSGDLSVKTLSDVMNTDVGAYAQMSNKLLEISHDTSNKFFQN
uniref:Uncharacterized protein n=1 Tax=Tanacetum cinerariifolium TaxID=118510 RepID=A0A6L2K561_TANCI|nr:hypothetical protein [Tanacetum cinerariifolium]